MSQSKTRITKFVGGPADGYTHEFPDSPFNLLTEPYGSKIHEEFKSGKRTELVYYVNSGRKDNEGRELWIVDASDKE